MRATERRHHTLAMTEEKSRQGLTEAAAGIETENRVNWLGLRR